MVRFAAGSASLWRSVQIGGSMYLVPANGDDGVAVPDERGGHILLNTDGTTFFPDDMSVSGDLSMSSTKTVDGQDISSDVYSPAYFCGTTSSDINTNGTTEVDILWDCVAGHKEAFTHSDGEADIVFNDTGIYLISCTLTSNYNNNNQIHYIHLYYDETGTGESAYVEETDARRYTHTSSAAATQVCLVDFPLTVSYTGATLKITGDFNAAQAGTAWKDGKCNITIKKVNKII